MENKQQCPECKKKKLAYNELNGELICVKCGLVILEQDMYMGKYGGND